MKVACRSESEARKAFFREAKKRLARQETACQLGV